LTTVTISTRWISRPIRSMTDLMQRLAAGDLSVTIGDSERQDEIGAMVRAVAVFRDNAVEKQVAEEALRAEKERAQQYLDIAGVVLVALDVNGNITLVNRKGLELLGYEETELMGRNWFETCLPEPLRKDVQSVFVELMAGKVEQAEYHENLVLTKSGEERIIAWRNALLRNADGKITGTLSSGEDITERVRLETIRAQAEAALITVHERMEDAQQVAKIGNWELSLADMTLEWSEEVFRIFGLDPSSTEPSIDAFWDSVHPDDRMMVQERSTQHLTSFGQDARYTYRIQLPDGTIKHLEHTGRQRCDDEGNILSVYGTIQDVTERAQADEALRESHRRLEETLSELRETQDKMVQQERLAAVGQLAGGIAHDFNNLLTAIMLYAHMPLSEPDLSPELKRSFETIFDESRHAADLVQQILDFSRRSPLHTQPFDLRPFVKEAIRMLERTIPESIHIHVEAGQETYAIDADATRIQQVLMNLALNARDAMPDGGELRIGLAHASVQPDEIPPIPEMAPGKWVCLTVSDTGSGIPLTARPHIFEPFFTTKAVGEGTGLGLAQVYGIVKQHGGHIDYETEMGEGTAFHVYLPAHQSSVEAAAGEAEFDIPVGSGETILLVEDEEQIRLGGQAVLESLGYRVLTAEDGQAALEILQTEEKVDLVITDVVMPRMGGKSLLQELRKMTPDLKTLAITGYVAQQDIAALRQDGFTGIIHKPFDMDTLASMVRQVLDAG
jgi:PAS domain S-box-containing protein